MLCRAGELRRNGLIDLRSRGTGKRTAIVARGTRSYRLIWSGMNKIVRSTSATLCSIERSNALKWHVRRLRHRVNQYLTGVVFA